MDSLKINKVQLRNLQIEDYEQLAQSFTRVYTDGSDVFWTHKQIEKLIRIFPEGQIVTVVDEKIVGCALSIIVNYDDVKNDHTYAQVTGKETFNTHNPKGNILYGIEVFIHPQYRGLRLARRMYEYRKELCETLNLKAIMFGGRIPNYYKYSDQLRPKEYIDKVKQKEIFDPVLTFQLSNDFHVRKVMRNYLPNDEESKHYACLLQWDNIYYQEPTEEYIAPKTTVRVGLVQWQMRSYQTLDDLFEQVEFFVDAVSDYKSDFILFPEYFNAPLMAKFNNEGESQAIRGLAAYTEEIRERFVKLAISYNINIITGSMPLIKEDGQHDAPDDAKAHEKRDGREALRRHFRGGQALHADLLGGGLRDLRLIVQRPDDRQPQPRPRRPETAGQRDDAQQNADARQRRERRARDDHALHFHPVHPDGKTRAPRADEKHDADERDERDNAAADQIHHRTVELG